MFRLLLFGANQVSPAGRRRSVLTITILSLKKKHRIKTLRVSTYETIMSALPEKWYVFTSGAR